MIIVRVNFFFFFQKLFKLLFSRLTGRFSAEWYRILLRICPFFFFFVGSLIIYLFISFDSPWILFVSTVLARMFIDFIELRSTKESTNDFDKNKTCNNEKYVTRATFVSNKRQNINNPKFNHEYNISRAKPLCSEYFSSSFQPELNPQIRTSCKCFTSVFLILFVFNHIRSTAFIFRFKSYYNYGCLCRP